MSEEWPHYEMLPIHPDDIDPDGPLSGLRELLIAERRALGIMANALDRSLRQKHAYYRRREQEEDGGQP